MRKLVLYVSEHCPPCIYQRRMWADPVANLLHDPGQVEVVQLEGNFEEARRRHITRTPTAILFEDGEEKARYTGDRHPGIGETADWLEGRERKELT